MADFGGFRDFSGILGKLASIFLRQGQAEAEKWSLGDPAENNFHLDVRFLTDPSLGFALLHTEGDLKELDHYQTHPTIEIAPMVPDNYNA